MRRTFTLQMYNVTDEHRKPPSFSDEPSGTTQQILYTNLRRRVCVDKEWPFTAKLPVTFRLGFYHEWLNDCAVAVDTEIVIKALERCLCQSCAQVQAIQGVSTVATFHVFAKLEGVLVSVGIVSMAPEVRVIRDWEPKDTLQTVREYKQAIGMAIDDALHDCAMNSLDNDQLRDRLVEHARGLIVPRTDADVRVRDIVPSIRETVTHLIVNVAVELEGVQWRETVIETRALAAT